MYLPILIEVIALSQPQIAIMRYIYLDQKLITIVKQGNFLDYWVN